MPRSPKHNRNSAVVVPRRPMLRDIKTIGINAVHGRVWSEGDQDVGAALCIHALSESLFEKHLVRRHIRPDLHLQDFGLGKSLGNPRLLVQESDGCLRDYLSLLDGEVLDPAEVK